MAKRYIIDEVRADHWMVRMRDRETGEVVEVPLELGALWPGKLRGDAIPRDVSPSQDDPTEAPTPVLGPPLEPRGPSEGATSSEDDGTVPLAEPAPAKKPRKSRGEDKGMPRVTDPEDLKEVMASPALRSAEIDEDTIAADDVAALRKMQALMRRARGKRAGKRGDLGWDETTDAGRSGLVSRFGQGAFKILHASGDTYALFFEWDDGRYERLGCGAAEDLMNLANQRAQEDPPEPPPSHLSLELARLYCGSPEQKASAAERLEPAFAEAKRNTPGAAPQVSEAEANQQLTKSIERELANLETRKPRERKRRGEPSSEPPAPNAEMDRQLSESLKRALADLDAQEANERKGE